MGARYIAFDVETPNSANRRMCSIGLAVVEDGAIQDRYYTLVNPETSFASFNVSLTGISQRSVAHAPTFPQLWDTLRPLLEGGLLVAHNAAFDMGVLGKCLADYGISWHSTVDYACTCQIGRRCWPELSNHRLDTLCDRLDIRLDHHRADSDSVACARILLAALDTGLDCALFRRTYDLTACRTLQKRRASSKEKHGACG